MVNYNLRCNKGFTLLEVIIGITLLSFLMVGIFTIFDQSFQTKEQVVLEDREMMQLEVAISQLTKDIEQLYTPLYFSTKSGQSSSSTGQDGEDAGSGKQRKKTELEKHYEDNTKFTGVTELGHPIPLMENEDKSSFVFMTNGNKRKYEDDKESIFAWVKYALRSTPEKDRSSKENQGDYEIIRSYYATNIYSNEHPWDNVKPQVILRSIKEFSFAFWDEEKQKFVEKINDLKDKEVLKMIQVNLVYINSIGQEIEISRSFRPLWPYIKPTKEVKPGGLFDSP